MTPYYSDDLVTIYHGDCLDLGLSIETPAAIVSDPPYGMRWDNTITGGKNGSNPGGRTRLYGRPIVAWEKGGHGVYCYRDTAYRAEKAGHADAHPTQKPLALMRWCVGRTVSPLVIDPFMGSGTTLVAAKEAGRRAIGIEIEERYCEIAAKRCSQEVLGLSA